MEEWYEYNNYIIVDNKAYIRMGSLCWSRRSCADTKWEVYNANWEGNKRDGITIITEVGIPFVFFSRQWSFVGNLKHNNVELYKWDSNKLLSRGFSLTYGEIYDATKVYREVEELVNSLEKTGLMNYLLNILEDWLKPVPEQIRIPVIKRYIPDYEPKKDEEETIF